MAKTAKKSTKKSETAAKATETKDDGVLKLNRDEAAKLLRTMGFKETQKYSNELLERRLNKMDQYKANYDGTLDGKTEEQVDKVIAAKGKLKVTGEEPKGSKKDAPEKKGGDGKASGKGAGKKGGAKTKPTGAGVNAFGSRIGSKNAEVDAMLSKKPITMKAIKEKMGATFYNHLNGLIEQGLVKKTDDGYVTAK